MINFHFKVDSREQNPDLFLYFDVYSKEKSFSWQKEYLEVGDVVCGNICIERKEAGDFVSSIIDGRLKEQAMKMASNFEHRYIIIEGDIFRTKSNINHNAIIGKLTSLTVNYGIQIFMINNPAHFVYTCYSIVAKHYGKQELDIFQFKKIVHKLNDEDVRTAMLIQIPGVGIGRAKLISKFYNNLTVKEMFEKITFEELISINGIEKRIANKIINAINGK
jgi:ERCC4-type nuclease